MAKNQILTLSANTAKEYIEGKILYIAMALAVVLVIVTYVSIQFTYGIPLRVCIDVSLGLASLLLNGLAVFLGVNLIRKEIESRTIYMILSCSCSRDSFLLGKLLGLLLSLALAWSILFLTSTVLLYFITDSMPNLFVMAFIMIFFEATLLLFLALLLSLLFDAIMAVFLTISVYITGYGLEATKQLTMLETNIVAKKIVNVAQWIIPNFSLFDIKQHVLYDVTINTKDLVFIGCYFVLFLLVCYILIRLKFNKMDIQ